MSQQMLVGLAGFVLVTTITPGPNNMMLLASGVNFGFRRTLPHLLGISCGLAVMLLLVGLGLDRVVAGNPRLRAVMAVLSLAYVLWLAWKIATAGAPEVRRGARPMTFLQACAFQWVNPKAWAMVLSALIAYGAMPGGAAAVAAVFVTVGLPAISIWAAVGQGLRRWLAHPLRLRVFNGTMAVLLVLSMLPALAELV
ncbi:LysE family translocator [uncultured Paracoccus sp.]|uniref:LysE family translocator n=1 Tax=uncultured Paracoccus sp. TaxID=189685 RepID=UPI002635CB2B|nr:LysE family translocator [uncultured Paracoccus sp.]